MAIVYRLEKGEPLTVAEIDNNFRELAQHIEILREAVREPLRGLRFRVEGVHMCIETEAGVLLQRVELPLLSFQHKGIWRAGAIYVVNDIIVCDRGVFICQQSHTATEWSADERYWALLLDSRVFEGSTRSSESAAAAGVEGRGHTPSLPVFARSDMPEPQLGRQGYVAQADGTLLLVYANGSHWRLQHNHEIVS